MLEVIELPNDVTWRTAGNTRNGTQALQIGAVAYSAVNGLAGVPARDEDFSFLNTADRYVRSKLSIAIIGFELVEIIRHLDDASPNWLGSSSVRNRID